MKTQQDILYDKEIELRASSREWCGEISSRVFNIIRSERRRKFIFSASIALPAAAAVIFALALLFSYRSSGSDAANQLSPVAKMIYTDDLSGFMSHEVDQIVGYGY